MLGLVRLATQNFDKGFQPKWVGITLVPFGGRGATRPCTFLSTATKTKIAREHGLLMNFGSYKFQIRKYVMSLELPNV